MKTRYQSLLLLVTLLGITGWIGVQIYQRNARNQVKESVRQRISFEELRSAVRDTARSAFTAIRKQHANETFYCFSLNTNDCAHFLYASAGSEEHLQRFIDKEQIDDSEINDWRFAPDVKYQEFDHFTAVDEILNKSKTLADAMDVESEEFRWLTSQLFAAIVDGFRDLDNEGFFGDGAEREKVLLFIDGDLDREFMLSFAKKLNPSSVYQRFANR